MAIHSAILCCWQQICKLSNSSIYSPRKRSRCLTCSTCSSKLLATRTAITNHTTAQRKMLRKSSQRKRAADSVPIETCFAEKLREGVEKAKRRAEGNSLTWISRASESISLFGESLAKAQPVNFFLRSQPRRPCTRMCFAWLSYMGRFYCTSHRVAKKSLKSHCADSYLKATFLKVTLKSL